MCLDVCLCLCVCVCVCVCVRLSRSCVLVLTSPSAHVSTWVPPLTTQCCVSPLVTCYLGWMTRKSMRQRATL